MCAELDAKAILNPLHKGKGCKEAKNKYASSQQGTFGMQVYKLQDVLYAMPETSGAAPQAFLDVEEPEDEDGIDEVVERPNKRHRNSSCMDLV